MPEQKGRIRRYHFSFYHTVTNSGAVTFGHAW